MNRLRITITAITSAAILFACATTDLVVGDDSPTLPPDGASSDPNPNNNNNGSDAAPLNGDGGGNGGDSAPDAKVPDASPPATCSAPSTCIPNSQPCKTLANGDGKGCAPANQLCCALTCPQLSPPAPTFCDGGPIAPLYDSSKCIVGYACAPVACSTAGGGCVGLSPTSCPNGTFGDANKYSCGGGIGTACCLP